MLAWLKAGTVFGVSYSSFGRPHDAHMNSLTQTYKQNYPQTFLFLALFWKQGYLTSHRFYAKQI